MTINRRPRLIVPTLRDVKEPMHCSKRVGHGVPGVAVWPCCGWIPSIGITSGILPFHFNSTEMSKKLI